jgi:hypothetical protein
LSQPKRAGTVEALGYRSLQVNTGWVSGETTLIMRL